MTTVNTSESTKIATKLIPKLVFECKIPIENMKTDCVTNYTKTKRVDILISEVTNSSVKYEDELLTIIEVKQEDAKVLNIYDSHGGISGELLDLINKNLIIYEQNSSSIEYGNVREKDWLNALIQGKWKAEKLNLNFFAVSNTKEIIFYHTNTLLPIKIKRSVSSINPANVITTKIIEEAVNYYPTYSILKDLKQKISKNNRICDFTSLSYEDRNKKNSMTEQDFIQFLNRIHNDFYKKQLEGSNEYLGDVILTFIFFKYLEEKLVSLNKVDKYRNDCIKLWSDWCDYSDEIDSDKKGKAIYDKLKREMEELKPNDKADKTESGEYKDGYECEYREFHNILVPIDKIDTNKKGYEFILAIYEGLNGKDSNKPLYLHGCDFDVYGAIYEKFMDTNQKKELGQYYTKRHISNVLAILTLKPFVEKMKQEVNNSVREAEQKGNKLKVDDFVEIIYNHYANLKIIDPSCGTGGILTECYSYLVGEYRNILNTRNAKIDELLSSKIFTGIDKQLDCVEKTKLNMFFAGDGHTDIHYGSSLDPLNGQTIMFSSNCANNRWNVLISNPPYGQGQEYDFIKKYIQASAYEGRIGLIIPNGVLENPSKFYMEFREFIIKNMRIESIISIPKFAFAPYAKQKTYMLIGYKRNEYTIKQLNNEDYVSDDGNERITIKDLEEKIWCYIMDYDGFNLSDDRWSTNLVAYKDSKPYFLHNDIPELIEKYLGENIEKINQLHIDGSFIGKKVIIEGKEQFKLNKAQFIMLNQEVNEKNFWNLLPETYMRPHESEYITLEEMDKKIKEIESDLFNLINEK